MRGEVPFQVRRGRRERGASTTCFDSAIVSDDRGFVLADQGTLNANGKFIVDELYLMTRRHCTLSDQ